jgi:hypothetical protein
MSQSTTSNGHALEHDVEGSEVNQSRSHIGLVFNRDAGQCGLGASSSPDLRNVCRHTECKDCIPTEQHQHRNNVHIERDSNPRDVEYSTPP